MIGTTLGQRYTLLRLLGKGGMGSVYEAEHSDTGQRVAVKILHRHLLEPTGDGPVRFRREAEAARAIGGEHIVRLLDAGTDEPTGHLYLVTECLDGEDLQRLLDRQGPLVPDAALRIALQALAGLCDAHQARVVHRDIKPANLFLARQPGGAIRVKLLDFGIAKLRADSLGLSRTTGLTTSGGFLGSPLYMSPEQVQSSRDVDGRTDVWSLGSTLYAALAGRAPHQHLASVGQLLVAICVSPAPPLSEVAPWVPAEVAELVHRALAIQPEARYPSAAAMLADIRRLLPSSALDESMLVPSGEQAHPVTVSTFPPSPRSSTAKVVVALDRNRPIRGDEATEYADPTAQPSARSAVPAMGARVAGRHITVDPRRILGEKSELWTFSLEVHRNVSSLVGRVWKALRRAGAKLPPMTYGTAWVLFEPRTGRKIAELGQGLDQLSLDDAGIRPGTVLWVVEPAADPRAS